MTGGLVNSLSRQLVRLCHISSSLRNSWNMTKTRSEMVLPLRQSKWISTFITAVERARIISIKWNPRMIKEKSPKYGLNLFRNQENPAILLIKMICFSFLSFRSKVLLNVIYVLNVWLEKIKPFLDLVQWSLI